MYFYFLTSLENPSLTRAGPLIHGKCSFVRPGDAGSLILVLDVSTTSLSSLFRIERISEPGLGNYRFLLYSGILKAEMGYFRQILTLPFIYSSELAMTFDSCLGECDRYQWYDSQERKANKVHSGSRRVLSRSCGSSRKRVGNWESRRFT